MPLVEWTDEFSVANPSMDEHHRRLFAIINRLHDAVQGASDAGAIIDELIDYAGYHFAAEEALLEQAGYAGLGEQRGEHRRFIAELRALQDVYLSGLGPLAASKTLTTSVRWLEQHVLRLDHGYAGLI